MTYKRLFNTFFPKPLWKLTPTRLKQLNHWKGQQEGDPHGFRKYRIMERKKVAKIIGEVKLLVAEYEPIMELGCNCGYLLSKLRQEGFTNFHAIEVSKEAIDYGEEKRYLGNVRVYHNSFEEALPFLSRNLSYVLVLSCGSTVSAVHPSFDIIRHICKLSRQYVMLVDEDNEGYAYPRVLEYEFKKWGFELISHTQEPEIMVWRKK